ncbi:MAG TPA: GNAT family N-acetyltransferase [Micromonosporaceae bacterium]|nr:GNAT family N-acetyltransferase [Micromonosporaceae bacterium]HCU48627.1 GNAT family N-acetyltransferase [Micromonosporaceae bacterium]
MVSIASAVPDDAEMIVDLLDEMDEFYGDEPTETRDERLAQVRAYVFESLSPLTVIVARADDGPVVGLASCSLLWPAARTSRSLYLKELYVLRHWRGKGVGKQLMTAVEGIAEDLGCSRVEFTTDTANEEAQAFYGSLGYTVNNGKLFYRRALD